ncbi:VC0807 family protein [Bacillus toyonensis]|uniref:VC0807 family protein n=1 Tax=Bacillus toyonensis TaxID=155322 RepID=UPI000BFD43F3|nr:VC0807 family protein [Bacillus toyonensis]PHG66549.1 hypothetical protein COI59_13780 [Bacillus toyonensis]
MNNSRNTLIITLIINIILPYTIYKLLVPYTTIVTALTIVLIAPLLEIIYSLIRTHKIDIFSTIILFSLALSIITVQIGGDEKFILLRESYITGIIGVVFLISLLFSKPLIFYLAKKFSVNSQWNTMSTAKKQTFRILTGVWGGMLILETLIKIILVYQLPVTTFLIVTPLLTYGLIGITILWTVRYVKNRKTL